MKFKSLQRIVLAFIVFSLVITLAFYVGAGILTGKLLLGEKPVSEQVGEAAKTIKDGFNKGFYGDSTQVDTVKIKE